MQQEHGVPISDPADRKLAWLRSQVIGKDVEFDAPYGKRRLTYADHTASGRCLQFAEDYVLTQVLPSYGNSHTTDSFVGQQTTKAMREAAEYVKKRMGGGDEDKIILCGAGMTAAVKRIQEVIGITVPSIRREKELKNLSKEERWVVFVGPYEHHSNLLSWRESLAEVIEISLDENGLIDMKELTSKLDHYKSENRPMLGSFSACSNVTGLYTDTRAMARLLHQYNAYACFDFASSGPYVKIDMKSGQEDGYDAVYLSAHKFLGGPCSPGILLLNKKLYKLGLSPPSTCGGGTIDFVNGMAEKYTLYVKSVEEREEAGTPPLIQKVRAALAFWVKEYFGHDTIENVGRNYIEEAIRRLRPNQNVDVLGNTTASRHAILSFLIRSTTPDPSQRGKPLPGAFVSTLINDLFGIQTRGGCDCAGPYGHRLLNIDDNLSLRIRDAVEMGYLGAKPGWTRLSLVYYTSRDEFDFILETIEFLATYAQRFLPLYDLDWKSGSWSYKKNVMKTLNGIQNNSNSCGSLPANKIIKGSKNSDYKVGHHRVDTRESTLNSKFHEYLEIAKAKAMELPAYILEP